MIKLKLTKTAKKLVAYGLSIAMIMSFSATGVSANTAEQTDIAETLSENQYTPALLIRTETATGSAVSGTTTGSAVSGTTTGSGILAPPNYIITDNDTTTSATPTPVPGSDSDTNITDNTGSDTDTTSTPSPETPETPDATDDTTSGTNATPAAIGTMITVGNYTYKVTSQNTVTLKGFADGASKASVIVKNKVTYDGIVYNVTKVGNAAFHNKTAVKSVIIRKNITDIGKNAFNGCTNITKATIRGATIIRKKAFLNCTKLKTVNITSTVLATVKKTAFKNIKAKATINVMNAATRKLVKAVVATTITVNKM